MSPRIHMKRASGQLGQGFSLLLTEEHWLVKIQTGVAKESGMIEDDERSDLRCLYKQMVCESIS